MSLRTTLALFTCLITATARALDVDSGKDAIRLAQAMADLEPKFQSPDPGTQGWARLRGIDLSKTPETREALLKLRSNGIRTCVFLRLSSPDWKRKYLPDDLRESYEHGRKLGTAFGDLVDAWEVDNEPDLGFVPESAERYTAFLKAMYLGLKAGARSARLSDGSYSLSGAKPNNQQPITNNPNDPIRTNVPLVLMGSLGLPPGPWLERFAANDGFAYTDGFNYHYYGYADDFTGVYRQFEEAVKQISVESYQLSGVPTHNLQPITNNLSQKNLPIFLTEIGYGMLGKEARGTKEGRLRQWRWFKSVGEQIAALRPEAPMAFYLPPYLEYDASEYGLTVPPAGTVKLLDEGSSLLVKSGESWTAGGVTYSPGDFGVERAEPWMENIGKKIGANEITPALAQWLAARSEQLSDQGSRLSDSAPNNPQPITNNHDGSRAWSVSVPRPSPVVLDFLPGEGLSHVKRYNGSFVTGREPPVHPKAESVKLKAEDAKPQTPDPKAKTPAVPSRSEELILQVRSQNGNLFEVYPTRQATPEWQRFMEPGDNFTMAFYGRAALPWRFKDNKPASLLVVMYPKSLPATYEFRRPQLLKLGEKVGRVTASAEASREGRIPNAPSHADPGGLGIIRPTTDPIANNRYGSGRIVLYNFSDKPVTGRLTLPAGLSFAPITDNSQPITRDSIVLAPHERREIPVRIQVSVNSYERIPVEITFVSDGQLSVEGDSLSGSAPNNPHPVTNNPSVTVSRHRTDLIPDIAGLPATLVADLLAQRTDDRGQTTVDGRQPNNQEPSTNNRDFVATRPRASEEALMSEQTGWFAQSGAQVALTADGFAVTVTARPPGKVQRIEVEIPWPDGLEFPEDGFLSVEFRLR
jgi:hypothetical protein